jgi:general secretion pathway protein E
VKPADAHAIAADLAMGLLAPERVARARTAAAERRMSVVQCLEDESGLAPDEFTRALGEALGYPVARMDDLYAWQPAFDLLPFPEALKAQCILFRDGEGALRMVLGDPFAAQRLAWGEERIAAPFAWQLAHHADVAAFLARYEETAFAMDGALPTAPGAGQVEPGIEELSFKTITEETSPVVRLVRSTLYDALKSGASDVHLESVPTGLAIKYRIDGVLNAVGSLEGTELAEQVISRVKVMSELDIAERRIPQDGRFKAAVRGREIDFRVSIMPSIFGEDAVLRVLDKQSLSDELLGLRLENLGFDAVALAAIRRLANEPYGMLLVTGPTGSGKTTTLYATISEINNGRDKIITIEDPVEYQLPGVLQIPVNEKKGLTFARGLRSILRHDPDRILVGEIRDAETAQIAIQAALTGHLVFTTVHANNVFDVLGRFSHMAVDPYSFVSALNGIVAQRLVRKICPNCAVAEAPSRELLRESGLVPSKVAGFDFRTGRGCGQCRGTGYKGRRAIAEILLLTDEMREMIVARTPIRALKEAAQASGTRFLRKAALECVRAGETDLKEINRVTFVA